MTRAATAPRKLAGGDGARPQTTGLDGKVAGARSEGLIGGAHNGTTVVLALLD